MIGGPTERVIAINGSGGARVDIAASINCREMTIEECPDANGAYAPQGLTYTRVEDNFAAVQNLLAGDRISLGDRRGPAGRNAGIIGFAAQSPATGGSNNQAATVLVKLRSQTVTGTQVRVKEWP